MPIELKRYRYYNPTDQYAAEVAVEYDAEFGTWAGSVVLSASASDEAEALRGLVRAARQFIAIFEGKEAPSTPPPPSPCCAFFAGAEGGEMCPACYQAKL